MIKLKLKETLLERGVFHPHAWLMSELRFNNTKASNMLNGKLKALFFDDADVICRTLDIAPNDLLYYVQDGRQQPLKPGHKLYALEAPPMISDLSQLFSKSDPQKVKEMVRELERDFREHGKG